jgi:hypothetical protein
MSISLAKFNPKRFSKIPRIYTRKTKNNNNKIFPISLSKNREILAQKKHWLMGATFLPSLILLFFVFSFLSFWVGFSYLAMICFSNPIFLPPSSSPPPTPLWFVFSCLFSLGNLIFPPLPMQSNLKQLDSNIQSNVHTYMKEDR